MDCLLPLYHPDSSYVVDAIFYVHGDRKRQKCIERIPTDLQPYITYDS